MINKPTTSRTYSLLNPFSGPDHICVVCAKDAHHAAGTAFPSGLSTRVFYGSCAACGHSTEVVPAELFQVPAPTRRAHQFAAAVLAVGHPNSIGRTRARSEAGRYWVEFQPIGGMAIHTEATRSPAAAVALFVEAAAWYPARPVVIYESA